MGVVGVVDAAIVVGSLIAVLGVGLLAALRSAGNGDAASEFFLAGRSSSWWLIAASLVASNIGTEHFVGQAGAAAYSGAVLSLYEWLAAYLVLALGWLFAPVYLRVGLTTIPQLLEDRFNKYCRAMYVGILLVLYVLAKIGTSVYAGVVLLEVIVGWSMWRSVPLIIVSTALYTMGGGLKTVMYTDALQLVIFLVGGFAGAITSFNLVGGMQGLFEKYHDAGLVDAPHVFRSLDDRDYPWLAMALSIPISSVTYWCTDQEMAQRVLAEKNLSEVRLGTSTAGLLKILPPFITVFPGMVARALFEACQHDPDHAKFPEWCSANLDDSKSADRAYPLLIVNNFPSGIKGLMIASFLAAMMSSISSVFNSASTVFTYDIYERIFGPPGGSSPQRLTVVGRLLICLITLLTLCYLPVIDKMDRGVYVLGCAALSHFAPPLSALFVAGIFVRRSNGRGALVGFAMGSLLGFARFALFILYQAECDADCIGHKQVLTIRNWFFCLNFNYFAVLLFVVTLAVIVGVSLLFPEFDPQNVEDYTFRLKDLGPETHAAPPSSYTPHEPLLMEEAIVPKLWHRWTYDNGNRKYWVAVVVSVAAVIAVATCLFIFR